VKPEKKAKKKNKVKVCKVRVEPKTIGRAAGTQLLHHQQDVFLTK